jgi:hypothetical protein
MSTMSKESGMMSSNDLGVNGWGSDPSVDWSVNCNWGGDINVVNNLSNMDLRLDLSDLWSDLSVSSDWGKNLFLGHKGSEISGLSGTESDGLVRHSDWSNGGSSLNNGGIPDGNGLNWSNGLDLLNSDLLVNWGRHDVLDVLLDGNGLKGWSLKVWDGWLDDLLRISSNNGSGFVVDGLGDWHGNMSHSWGMNDGWGVGNGVVSGHGGGSNDSWSHTHSQRLSGGWELLDNSSGSGDDHGGHEGQEDQRVHFDVGFEGLLLRNAEEQLANEM